MRARRAPMGPYSEVVLVCMYVCMSIRNGFMTEVYEFTYSVCTLRHVPVLGRLRGETTTPGQRTRPEVQKTFK